jgi:hypothetical protein
MARDRRGTLDRAWLRAQPLEVSLPNFLPIMISEFRLHRHAVVVSDDHFLPISVPILRLQQEANSG